MADTLRGLVGQRDKKATHVEFAYRALAAIGVGLLDQVKRAQTGADLLIAAHERQALIRDAPLPGDLVFFDKTDGVTDASLVGVVVSIAPRDQLTVEFVYLDRKVVRRGYVTPSSPKVQRDGQGRALNTFVRHLTSKGKKSDPFLAGELFRTFVRIDLLTQ